MRNKKAKALRKLARQLTPDAPERAWNKDARPPVFEHVPDLRLFRAGMDLAALPKVIRKTVRGVPSRLHNLCTRDMYKHLKKATA